MERKQGKFTLFDESGFVNWLAKQTVSRQITLVQNHHTFMPDYSTFKGDNHFAMQASMESSHRGRGFDAIAQTFTTFPDGTIMTGRSLETIPAGIKGANSTGICLEHIGNFDKGGDAMSDLHRRFIVAVNALLCRKFNLPADTDHIVYHHWYDLDSGTRLNGAGSTKSCPGTAFFGGNKVTDAEQNFIPLVRAAMQAVAMPPLLSKPPLWRGRVVDTESLNVRDKPSAAAKKVKTLAPEVVVGIYAEQDGWLRIDPVEALWVNRKYLAKVS